VRPQKEALPYMKLEVARDEYYKRQNSINEVKGVNI
jgi:hypothetical protein